MWNRLFSAAIVALIGWSGAAAVSTTSRASALPDLPTMIGAGFPDSDYNFWVGVFAPAKTPRDVIDRLHEETENALKSRRSRTSSRRSAPSRC